MRGMTIEDTAPAHNLRPLCVDLDGTLVKSDTFVDSVLLLVRKNPLIFIQILYWVLLGKAIAKQEVSSRAALDATHLPFSPSVVAYLKSQKAENRRIYLTTGADRELASRIASHLGFFDGVLASDGVTNLIGRQKYENLRHRFGDTGYDYIGNAHHDLPLLKHADTAIVANGSHILKVKMLLKRVRVSGQFDDRVGFARATLKALRPHQWAKNLLVLIPLALAHTLTAQQALSAAIAFFCISACASSTYIVNDLLDLDADRRHPEKRLRPFAAGDISVVSGLAIGLLSCVLGIAVAYMLLPIRFLMWLCLYLAATLGYSLYLKRIAIADVILLAGLYTGRVLAGGAATHVAISHWLAAYSMFMFLSLAIAKRFSELQNVLRRGTELSNGRGYLLGDLEQLRSFGTASGYASVVVFALYISGHDVTALYLHPNWLWLIVPFMIFWLSRVWLLAGRGELHEDPVIFAVTDRVSLLIAVLVVLIVTLAAAS